MLATLRCRRLRSGGGQLAFQFGLCGDVLRLAAAVVILVGIEEVVVEFNAGAAFIPFDVVETVRVDGAAEGPAGPGDDGVSGTGGALFGVA